MSVDGGGESGGVVCRIVAGNDDDEGETGGEVTGQSLGGRVKGAGSVPGGGRRERVLKPTTGSHQIELRLIIESELNSWAGKCEGAGWSRARSRVAVRGGRTGGQTSGQTGERADKQAGERASERAGDYFGFARR